MGRHTKLNVELLSSTSARALIKAIEFERKLEDGHQQAAFPLSKLKRQIKEGNWHLGPWENKWSSDMWKLNGSRMWEPV